MTACAHRDIVPCPPDATDESGIVWGKCLGCGDDTFVLHEPGFGDPEAQELESLRAAGAHIEKLEEELSQLRRMAYEFGWIGTGKLEEWLRYKLTIKP